MRICDDDRVKRAIRRNSSESLNIEYDERNAYSFEVRSNCELEAGLLQLGLVDEKFSCFLLYSFCVSSLSVALISNAVR